MLLDVDVHMGYQYLFPAQERDVKCYWMLMYDGIPVLVSSTRTRYEMLLDVDV